MKKLILLPIICFLGVNTLAQSVNTIPDGIELGDSTKLSWYSLFSSARFMSKGTTNFSLHFQNKNLYDFSKISNTLQNTEFNASKNLTLSTGSLPNKNQILLRNESDTTAIIESFGMPYSMLDFRMDNGGFLSGPSGSQGQIYTQQSSPFSNIPSRFTMKAKEQLNLIHDHSYRVWQGSDLRLFQIGDKLSINPTPLFTGGYSSPIANLDVNGSIRSSSLTGSGNRRVLVNENGILEANNIEEVISYGINNLIPGDEDYKYSINYSSNLAWMSPSFSGEFLRCPLQLPNGAKIKELKVNYFKNSSSRDLFIQLVGRSISTTYYQLYQEKTLSSSSTFMQVTNFTTNHTVNNSESTYALVFSTKDNGGNFSTWPNNDIGIRSIIVTLEY